MPQYRPKDSPDVLIVDGLNMAFKAFHAVKGLTYNGQDTNVLKGMMVSLLSIIEKFAPRHIIFVWEGRGGKKRRKDIIPQYKEGRTALEKNDLTSLFRQVDIFKELCFSIGCGEIAVNTYEADDVMYVLSDLLAQVGKSSTIITSDQDLIQAIQKKVSWYDTTKGLLLTSYTVFNNLGIKLERFVDYKCLVKDNSDNLDGVAGVGPVTAKKLLNERTLDEAIADPPTKGKLKVLGTLECQETIKKMRQVVDLNHFVCTELIEAVKEQANKALLEPEWEEIWDILEENGFFHIINKFPEFKETLQILDTKGFMDDSSDRKED